MAFNFGPSPDILKKLMLGGMPDTTNQIGTPMTQMPGQMGSPYNTGFNGGMIPPTPMQGPIDVGANMNIGAMPRMAPPSPMMSPTMSRPKPFMGGSARPTQPSMMNQNRMMKRPNIRKRVL